MTWKIKVTHIDDKTGECVASEATLTDIVVAESEGEALDYAQYLMTHKINQKIEEKNT